MNKLRRFPLKPLALSMGTLALAACGGTGQDVGQAATFSQDFSGVAVDGHLARARVFFDYDNNGTRGPWEPFAYTDNQGYYSYNPNTDTDYCADSEAETAIFCLRADQQKDSVMIRVDGGYDIVTGEPFHGQMSRRLNVSAGEAVASAVISPLTSMVSEVRSEQDKQALLAAMGITEADLSIDYFNSDGKGQVDQALFNTAVKLHKINNLMADAIEDHYRDVLSMPGTPDDLSASVYRHVGAQLLAHDLSLAQAVSSDAFIGSVLRAAETDARELFRKKDMALPDGASTGDLVDSTRISGRVNAMARVIDSLLPPGEPADTATLNGRARAVEALLLKGLKDSHGSDTSIDAAASFFTSEANRGNIDSLVTALSQKDVDLNALVRNNFAGDDLRSEESINAAFRLPSGATAFRGLAGTRLRIADMDLGFGPNDLRDSEVEAYFVGEQGATEGRLVACIKHVTEASTDGKMGHASTRGERVVGQWSLLSPDAEDGSSYSVVLTLKFLGASYQAIMKSAGTETVDGALMQLIRFDYAGEIASWHSEHGVQPQEGVPATNKDCVARLPSRIGL